MSRTERAVVRLHTAVRHLSVGCGADPATAAAADLLQCNSNEQQSSTDSYQLSGTFLHGGELVARVLCAQGVRVLFTLTGGHISPLLIAARRLGLRVVDVRHEQTAAFAADALARLAGGAAVGVCAVTAGPGLTNTITAVKNAQLAQSPLLVLGGATATLLKGRGALQDIDQQALFRGQVKEQLAVTSVADIIPSLQRAIRTALTPPRGPVFVELPLDVLYPSALMARETCAQLPPSSTSLSARLVNAYVARQLSAVYNLPDRSRSAQPPPPALAHLPAVCLPPLCAQSPSLCSAPQHRVEAVVRLLLTAHRPLLIVGSALCHLGPGAVYQAAGALRFLRLPLFCSGMARGLLGRFGCLHDTSNTAGDDSGPWLLCRHKRAVALKRADVVVLLGVPQDFRLGYGNSIPSSCKIVAVATDVDTLMLNRTPDVVALGEPADFIVRLAQTIVKNTHYQSAHERLCSTCLMPGSQGGWLAELRARDEERDQEIVKESQLIALPQHATAEISATTRLLNPLHVCLEVERTAAATNVVFIGDGGDFISTASYILRPRQPLGWLDPGPFGTLGVGFGFAMAAYLAGSRLEANGRESDAPPQVWLLCGDGSVGYGLVEFEVLVRHRIPVICVVGNDACWTQIARAQEEIFDGDSTATALSFAHYEESARSLGARGYRAVNEDELRTALAAAVVDAAAGWPVLVNCLIGKTNFRQGSMSV